MPDSRQFNTANCERTFVQRDFSEGTAVRFQTSPLPPRLSGKISPEEFAKAISELNQLFDEAESLSAAVVCENITACLFAYMLFLCMPTHYERSTCELEQVLEKISYRVIQLNSEVFVPKGLLMIDPAERGLRVVSFSFFVTF
ncbi:unnamed protein product [Schistocephalus solidus]|uniref:Ras modification protein ERF4 n=1 Tax=Schistocephalus solidus TaxID=70667 RepID=A0A183SQE1_SCHSO|nr:unnamed protein product [Schistocephalus solidus]